MICMWCSGLFKNNLANVFECVLGEVEVIFEVMFNLSVWVMCTCCLGVCCCEFEVSLW